MTVFFIPRQVQACRGICSPAERKTGAPPSQSLAGRASAVFPLPAEGIDESGAGRSMDYPLFAPLHGLPGIASPAHLLFSLSPARVPRGTEAVLELIWNQFIYNQYGVKELHRVFQELIIHDFSIP
ncbi:hypothetical protein [Akkermansia sp.]|uniref:hypothetical protein n=1 Tax=Akkermansia sp. TaxID=1872421 RepID=UPI0025C69754|nr:hypothetical protein [Akkermansia sp.]